MVSDSTLQDKKKDTKRKIEGVALLFSCLLSSVGTPYSESLCDIDTKTDGSDSIQ